MKKESSDLELDTERFRGIDLLGWGSPLRGCRLCALSDSKWWPKENVQRYLYDQPAGGRQYAQKFWLVLGWKTSRVTFILLSLVFHPISQSPILNLSVSTEKWNPLPTHNQTNISDELVSRHASLDKAWIDSHRSREKAVLSRGGEVLVKDTRMMRVGSCLTQCFALMSRADVLGNRSECDDELKLCPAALSHHLKDSLL